VAGGSFRREQHQARNERQRPRVASLRRLIAAGHAAREGGPASTVIGGSRKEMQMPM